MNIQVSQQLEVANTHLTQGDFEQDAFLFQDDNIEIFNANYIITDSMFEQFINYAENVKTARKHFEIGFGSCRILFHRCL